MLSGGQEIIQSGGTATLTTLAQGGTVDLGRLLPHRVLDSEGVMWFPSAGHPGRQSAMATKTWTHLAGAAAWGTDADWSPVGAPTTSDAAMFDSGTFGTTYAVTGNGTAGSLLDIGDDVTLTGTITISSALSQVRGGGTLTLVSTAHLSTTAYVLVGSQIDTTTGTLVVNGTTGSYGAYVGYNGAGTATVSGAGSVFSTSTVFYVGSGNAAGMLTVSNGGYAYTQGTFYLGSFSAGTGSQAANVVVTGTGSILSAPTLLIGLQTTATLAIDSGASASTAGATIYGLGALKLDDLSSFTGAINLSGGLIDAIPEQGGATTGAVALANAVTISSAGGFLESDGPTLNVTGPLSGAGALTINSGAVELSDASNSYSGAITNYGDLVLANATAAGTATIDLFGTADAQLTVEGATPANTITGFSGGDAIDLEKLAYVAGSTTATVEGNTLVVTNGTATDTLNATGLTDGHSYTVMRDASGAGTDVVACYCAGTLVATSRGEVLVEALAAGDTVETAFGQLRPVRWIGRRSYAGRFLRANPAVQPIRFRAGSLGAGLPHRDLLVSPEHAMFLDGILVAAKLLVNGTTIAPERGLKQIDYFHVELDSHDVLLAEGAPSESFVDDDSRGMFHNAAEWHAAHPSRERVPAAFCAPRAESGPDLDAIRRRLTEVASKIAQAA